MFVSSGVKARCRRNPAIDHGNTATFSRSGLGLRDMFEKAGGEVEGSDLSDSVALESLTKILDDIDANGLLDERGVREIGAYLTRTIESRAAVRRDRQLYPAIAAEPIEKPIFIVGLPKSSTTNLHNLLSCDPNFCFPNLGVHEPLTTAACLSGGRHGAD